MVATSPFRPSKSHKQPGTLKRSPPGSRCAMSRLELLRPSMGRSTGSASALAHWRTPPWHTGQQQQQQQPHGHLPSVSGQGGLHSGLLQANVTQPASHGGRSTAAACEYAAAAAAAAVSAFAVSDGAVAAGQPVGPPAPPLSSKRKAAGWQKGTANKRPTPATVSWQLPQLPTQLSAQHPITATYCSTHPAEGQYTGHIATALPGPCYLPAYPAVNQGLEALQGQGMHHQPFQHQGQGQQGGSTAAAPLQQQELMQLLDELLQEQGLQPAPSVDPTAEPSVDLQAVIDAALSDERLRDVLDGIAELDINKQETLAAAGRMTALGLTGCSLRPELGEPWPEDPFCPPHVHFYGAQPAQPMPLHEQQQQQEQQVADAVPAEAQYSSGSGSVQPRGAWQLLPDHHYVFQATVSALQQQPYAEAKGGAAAVGPMPPAAAVSGGVPVAATTAAGGGSSGAAVAAAGTSQESWQQQEVAASDTASRSVTSVKYTFQITNDNSRYELFVRKDMAKVLPRRGQMESGDVFLVDEHGMRWKVHDRRVKTQRHLKQGWKEFAEGHNLGTGSVLEFERHGDNRDSDTLYVKVLQRRAAAAAKGGQDVA